MLKSQNPLTARDVYKEVKKIHSAISLDTVYRNLSMLSEEGLISQLRFQTKGTSLFEYQKNNHHHHAVCVACEGVFCVEDCLTEELTKKPIEDKGFLVTNHIFEVYGFCSECQTF